MAFKQFAALPYRLREDDLQILLITTRKKRRWSIPKGWPIKRTAPHETALSKHTKRPACGRHLGKEDRAFPETKATEKAIDLDLHIDLLAEHELTRLTEMVSAIAQKLEVRTGAEPEIAEITKDVAPEVLLKEIEQQDDQD
ncbi:hypothetical protein [Bradyrhizobium retamae]|uniref:Uncharacterized protein n=1 Tax=Bradyrhizobium retamae TaxID=1300035 RepID=A0A0R3N5J1_9BRAD|nr:hypothetical protein [Bradyrhizobium retamae]KRR27650.1 hypothetical protein CQ13_04530 [Bradyrhizobium retamae]